MNGFEIRITPKCRLNLNEVDFKDGVWKLVNKDSKELTALAYLKV
jgi:pre-mRNA-processing factor 8